ncbi:MAG: hypothetical protein ACOYL6_15805 [Bacteriovoracaceae bacterium]
MKKSLLTLALISTYSSLAFGQASGPVYNFNFFNGETGKNAPQVPLAPGQTPAPPAPVQNPVNPTPVATPAATPAEQNAYSRSWGFQVGYGMDRYTGNQIKLETAGLSGGLIIPLGANFYLIPKYLMGKVSKAEKIYSNHSTLDVNSDVGTKAGYNGYEIQAGKDFAINEHFAFSLGGYYKSITAHSDSVYLARDNNNISASAAGIIVGPRIKGKIFELALNAQYGWGRGRYLGSGPGNPSDSNSITNIGGSANLAIDF